MLGRVNQAGRYSQESEDGKNHPRQLEMILPNVRAEPQTRGNLESLEGVVVHQKALEAEESQQAQVDQEIFLQHLAPERQRGYQSRCQGQDGQKVDDDQGLDQMRRPQPVAVPSEQIFQQEQQSNAVLEEVHDGMDRGREARHRPRRDEHRRKQDEERQLEFDQGRRQYEAKGSGAGKRAALPFIGAAVVALAVVVHAVVIIVARNDRIRINSPACFFTVGGMILQASAAVSRLALGHVGGSGALPQPRRHGGELGAYEQPPEPLREALAPGRGEEAPPAQPPGGVHVAVIVAATAAAAAVAVRRLEAVGRADGLGGGVRMRGLIIISLCFVVTPCCT
mmetsp:Transcript_30016/g.87712  ORF Transcript_30016/g.87712 Transcript_30016/m.87712 type:complete len:338 (+) Transcript_30016:82-1095(+)